MDAIEIALTDCDLFVSIGTSGHVYPAAGFVSLVRAHTRTVEINLGPSQGASLFVDARYGPATALIPAFVAEILATIDKKGA